MARKMYFRPQITRTINYTREMYLSGYVTTRVVMTTIGSLGEPLVVS